MANSWQLSLFGCALNLIVFGCVLLQVLKSSLIAFTTLKSPWQQRLVYYGCMVALLLDPVLIAVGLFGDLKTALVSLFFICFMLLLTLDFFTSHSFLTKDGLNQPADKRDDVYKIPAIVSFCGFSVYAILKALSIAMILYF